MSSDHDHAQSQSIELVERLLARWKPAQANINRDELMFLAGRASAASAPIPVSGLAVGSRSRRLPWIWPATSVALAATSLALAIALYRQPVRLVTVVAAPPVPVSVDNPLEHDSGASTASLASANRDESPAPPRTAARATSGHYIQTRDVALRIGVDALGNTTSQSFSAPIPSYFELMQGITSAGTPSNPKRLTNGFPNM
jgi:hypothetical protein